MTGDGNKVVIDDKKIKNYKICGEKNMQMKKNYVIFDPYYTNREGAWYFSPDEGEFCQGKACYGFGSVKYFDGSVYIGELYYDGVHPNEQGYVLFEQAIADAVANK